MQIYKYFSQITLIFTDFYSLFNFVRKRTDYTEEILGLLKFYCLILKFLVILQIVTI